MNRFKDIFIMIAFFIFCIVIFFFRGNDKALYMVSLLLWIGIVLESIVIIRLPRADKHISREIVKKSMIAIAAISSSFVVIESIQMIVNHERLQEFNVLSLVIMPMMILNALNRSKSIYFYESGIVSGYDIIAFEDIEFFEWKEDEPNGLRIVSRKEEYMLNIPSKKIQFVDEVLRANKKD